MFCFCQEKGVDEDITQYFRLALGCENFAESTANTSALIRALDAYVESKSFLNEDSKMEFREQKRDILHNYLSTKIKEKQPVSLRDITALISPTDEKIKENEFLEFIKSNDKFKIDETFNPHKGKVKDLERVSGKIKGGSVSFPITEIGESIFYDQDIRELKIQKVPDELHQRILNAKGS
ncbi:nucleoid-associated protein [Acinetobacter baumannii]|uniref:nucleoid-associated protein n=1 Tax=Acinetobacter baumannii TaxID=470 RepID=UPI002351E551|nr:nucleoid-associated protein [Acinetobacter baumannii]